jgi:trehalose 6-phosphate synthase
LHEFSAWPAISASFVHGEPRTFCVLFLVGVHRFRGVWRASSDAMRMSETEPTRGDLVIVSNRLPVNLVRRKRQRVWESSPGGLVSALRPILHGRTCTWIGWSGASDQSPEPFEFEGIQIVPVPLSHAEVRAFYEGFANRGLWPLYHDAIRKPEYRRDWWRVYQTVNERFAKAAAAAAADSATVWVHDYQLHLVPAMVRDLRSDLAIGFFLHIPFPPQELFAQLPWRAEILRGTMGADVVGFQAKVGAANFVQVCRRFGGATGTHELLEFEGRPIRAGSFPISIDFEHFEHLAASAAVAARREELRARLGRSRKLLLGIDRLDYTKGIDIRLRAFEELLSSGRVSREECVLVQVAVPSREHVNEYRRLRVQIERIVGEINGDYGDIGRTPVQYLHRSIDQIELAALYAAADVMLVTPLRDGMNLVSKEYAASRIDNSGVLVLSEFTGAAKELTSALIVNPHDIDGVADAMHRGLRMSANEQAARMTSIRRVIKRNDVHHWAQRFFEALKHAHVN